MVASLLDKPTNLGGLSRTCEVFKVAQLCVPSAKVLQHKDFVSLSVSASKWLPVAEVPEAALPAFLERKRRDGYEIVGLEQTTGSVPLHSHPFTSRTVLVLGREKGGIPAELLPLLDAAVEIPQLGLVRSLNVHVSASLAVYEYSRVQLAGAAT